MQFIGTLVNETSHYHGQNKVEHTSIVGVYLNNDTTLDFLQEFYPNAKDFGQIVGCGHIQTLAETLEDTIPTHNYRSEEISFVEALSLDSLQETCITKGVTNIFLLETGTWIEI